ncbi:hypothetical protein RHMOL_Rhmol04G0185800 [Rhododendron molle]|uniref:Uncharacterized protein n=1 Tax=Rhododendron molle TaxID=49168 RepID=A0ACC0P266_RHOML|nr:hypothetical protein RHMOL_Rhmol04G0185800 [Rhododendron molle]
MIWLITFSVIIFLLPIFQNNRLLVVAAPFVLFGCGLTKILGAGLKALEGQTKSKNGRGKSKDAEDSLVPIVYIEEYMFILVDDVLLLVERAALEPLPPKDGKGPQNGMKASFVNILLKIY